MIDNGTTGTPLPLVKDGDLSAAIHSMLRLRGYHTVRVSKVKGHATQAMVDNGDARHEDLIGNEGADTAADLGRLRQQDGVITARRALIRARSRWYPIMLALHKFMVAISRIEVNHDGYGRTVPDAMIWDKESILKPRASSLRVCVDHASLQGPPGFLDTSWCGVSPSPITQEDVACFCPTVSVEELYSAPHIHEQMTTSYYGYDIAYNFTHNNIMLEHNAMNNMNTITHMDAHNTQY